ncbi:MAG: TIGR03435 family protein [Acidobacteriaceae bacterium]|nr:TIGR03435 family protein [Acidobacteriaceae bacterium]
MILHFVRRAYDVMAVGVFSLLLLALTGSFCQAQAKPDASAADAKTVAEISPGATYDVATFKPHAESGMGMSTSIGSMPNGRFFAKGYTLKTLVCEAYDKLDFQCLGGPAWFGSETFDIEAKPDGALSEQLVKLSSEEREKVREQMQQALYADRIQLKVHHESRELPTFALVLAKGGSKMTEAKTFRGYSTRGGKIQSIKTDGISMESLVRLLSQKVGHKIQDQTGLKGFYVFTLNFSDDLDTTGDSSAPSIYTALQEQLGLKLVPMKAPVDVIVIDHVERPSAN